MSAYGKELHIASMRSQSSSILVAGLDSRPPTKSHTCSVGDIPGEKADQGRIFMGWAQY